MGGKPMELIERYAAAVAQRLPAKMRRDVEIELKSLIMDELESKVQPGEPYTEEDVVAVLRQIGAPREVALRYTPAPRYLIGPQLFDTYLLVSGIVIGAVFLGLAISLLLADHSSSVVGVLIKLLSASMQGAMGAIGAVTLIFAILERTLPDAEKKELATASDWDPRTLPAVAPAVELVKVADSITAICLTLVALAAINLLGLNAAGHFIDAGSWPILSLVDRAAIAFYRPYWNIVGLATLALHAILLNKRAWSTGARIGRIALSAGNIALLALLLSGPALLNPESVRSVPPSVAPEALQALGSILQTMFRVGFIVAIVVEVCEIARQASRLLKTMAEQAPGK
jgi:hypothetical protein